MPARLPARTPMIRVVACVLTTAVMFSGAAIAHAEVVQVDPGKSVSAGKPISGTGQNLPSLGAQRIWNIGASPAEFINSYYSSGAALRDQRDVALAARAWSTLPRLYGVRPRQRPAPQPPTRLRLQSSSLHALARCSGPKVLTVVTKPPVPLPLCSPYASARA